MFEHAKYKLINYSKTNYAHVIAISTACYPVPQNERRANSKASRRQWRSSCCHCKWRHLDRDNSIAQPHKQQQLHKLSTWYVCVYVCRCILCLLVGLGRRIARQMRVKLTACLEASHSHSSSGRQWGRPRARQPHTLCSLCCCSFSCCCCCQGAKHGNTHMRPYVASVCVRVCLIRSWSRSPAAFGGQAASQPVPSSNIIAVINLTQCTHEHTHIHTRTHINTSHRLGAAHACVSRWQLQL